MKMTKHDRPLKEPSITSYDPEGRKPYENRKAQWEEVKDAAKRNGVSYDNWIQRMTKLGHDYKQAAFTPNKSHVKYITVDGKKIKQMDFLSQYNLPQATWNRWVRTMSFAEALEKAKQRLNDRMNAK